MLVRCSCRASDASSPASFLNQSLLWKTLCRALTANSHRQSAPWGNLFFICWGTAKWAVMRPAQRRARAQISGRWRDWDLAWLLQSLKSFMRDVVCRVCSVFQSHWSTSCWVKVGQVAKSMATIIKLSNLNGVKFFCRQKAVSSVSFDPWGLPNGFCCKKYKAFRTFCELRCTAAAPGASGFHSYNNFYSRTFWIWNIYIDNDHVSVNNIVETQNLCTMMTIRSHVELRSTLFLLLRVGGAVWRPVQTDRRSEGSAAAQQPPDWERHGAPGQSFGKRQ